MGEKDDDLTESAKAKVGQAKTDSEEVQKRMQKALESIKSIMSEIQNMKDISIQDLDLLGKFPKFPLNIFLLTYIFQTKNSTRPKLSLKEPNLMTESTHFVVSEITKTLT